MDPFENNLRDALRESGNQPSVAARVMERLAANPAARTRGWRPLAMAAAAVFVLAVVSLTVVRYLTVAPIAVAESGETVRPGKNLRAEERTVLTLTDGSGVEMRAQSELSLERTDDGIRFHLDKGAVIVKAAKQLEGRHLYVQTRDMTVSVAGTVFLVNAETEGSRVAVLEGRVVVRLGTTETNLRLGEEVLTNTQAQFLPVKQEIEWSRDVQAYDALLLYDAAGKGQLEDVRRLLDRGADPNVALPLDATPLIFAAARGHIEIVRLLLDRGADPNQSDPGDGNPLIAAAGGGHAEVVSLLLDRGARIEAVVLHDENALITASKKGQLNVVKLLVSRGADVNAKVWTGPGPAPGQSAGEWRTPLNMARTERREDVVKFLISAGARE
jgi:hypothetical protein